MRPLGDRWRILAHQILPSGYSGEPVRLSSDDQTFPSEFDEVVIGNDADPCWFHLEQMTERDWWFAFYIDKDTRVCGNMRVFLTKPNELRVWTEGGGPVRRLEVPEDE